MIYIWYSISYIYDIYDIIYTIWYNYYHIYYNNINKYIYIKFNIIGQIHCIIVFWLSDSANLTNFVIQPVVWWPFDSLFFLFHFLRHLWSLIHSLPQILCQNSTKMSTCAVSTWPQWLKNRILEDISNHQMPNH